MSGKIYNVVVGTAGHIDHGKTSLIRSLTGIDADRLKEEKERGLTIDLGFAPLELPDGTRVGIIDVPGHEKFIKNMVAGAMGIDMVVLVVAADDSVMPQTREHLDIMTLLGLKRGLVALTKIDMVEEELVQMTQEEIEELVEGTFLEESPILPLSSTTGLGMDEFKKALFEMIQNCPPRKVEGVFRMPIQRVFAAKGHGTVVTGVPISGRVALGERLEVLPQGFVGRIRKIQAYKEELQEARAGHSTALNLSDMDYKKITRGNVVVPQNTFQSAKMLEGSFRYLSHLKKNLKNYSQVKLHVGTTEVMGKIVLLDKKVLQPGEHAYIQLILEEPVVIGLEDPYILRLPSPALTLGGGKLLGNSKKRLKGGKEEIIQGLMEKEKNISTPEGRLLSIFLSAGSVVLRKEELRKEAQLSKDEFDQAMENLLANQKIFTLGKSHLFFSQGQLKAICSRILAKLQDYHQTHPLSLGLEKSQLSRMISGVESDILEKALSTLEGEIICHPSKIIGLSSFEVELDDRQKSIYNKIQNLFKEQLFTPPHREDVPTILSEKPKNIPLLFDLLVHQGVLEEIQKIYFHREALVQLKKIVLEYFEKEEKLLSARAKELLQTSRKYAIPLLEYLDDIGLTTRVDNHRILKS